MCEPLHLSLKYPRICTNHVITFKNCSLTEKIHSLSRQSGVASVFTKGTVPPSINSLNTTTSMMYDGIIIVLLWKFVNLF